MSNIAEKKKIRTFEIIFYENLIKMKPDFIQALTCLAEIYTRNGFISEGLALDKHLAELRPEDPVIRYNLACSLALSGDTDWALRELTRAVLLGYDEFSYILQDPDLVLLRRSPLFGKFLAKLKRLNTKDR